MRAANPLDATPIPIAYAIHITGQHVACDCDPTSSMVRIDAIDTVPPTHNEKKKEAMETTLGDAERRIELLPIKPTADKSIIEISDPKR